MKKKILLVDDEELILRALSRDIRQRIRDADIVMAASGNEAAALLTVGSFCVVVTDLVMENGGGLDVLKAAKEKDPDMCVIILTGHGDLSTAIEALRLGADDYLLKPCEVEELVFRMQKCIANQELRRKIKIYEEILPICCVCKKIRDDSGKEPGMGAWLPVDVYLLQKTSVKLSHGYCPECGKKALDELG